MAATLITAPRVCLQCDWRVSFMVTVWNLRLVCPAIKRQLDSGY